MDEEYKGYSHQYKPIGAWGYVGLGILYAIPIIGFIFLLVFTFSDGNINRRSFTRSYWCRLLLTVVIFAAFFALARYTNVVETAVNSITDFVEEHMPESMDLPVSFSINQNGVGVEEAAADPAAFRDTMNSIEAVVDEYVEYAEKAKSGDLESVMNMTGLLSKYADVMTKLGKVDTGALSEEDFAYYTEVSGRISQKLAAVQNSD